MRRLRPLRFSNNSFSGKEMIFMKKAWFTFKYLVILYCIMTTVFDLVVCWRDDIKKAKEYYND
jgi:hypothetical protein